MTYSGSSKWKKNKEKKKRNLKRPIITITSILTHSKLHVTSQNENNFTNSNFASDWDWSRSSPIFAKRFLFGVLFAPWKENLGSDINWCSVSVVDHKTSNTSLTTLPETNNKSRIWRKVYRKPLIKCFLLKTVETYKTGPPSCLYLALNRVVGLLKHIIKLVSGDLVRTGFLTCSDK